MTVTMQQNHNSILTYLKSSQFGLQSEQLQCVLLIPDWQLDVLLWFIQQVCALSVVQLAANITLTQCLLGNLGLECFVFAVCVISQGLGQSFYFVQGRQEH